jgi:hypothetical protein
MAIPAGMRREPGLVWDSQKRAMNYAMDVVGLRDLSISQLTVIGDDDCATPKRELTILRESQTCSHAASSIWIPWRWQAVMIRPISSSDGGPGGGMTSEPTSLKNSTISCSRTAAKRAGFPDWLL